MLGQTEAQQLSPTGASQMAQGPGKMPCLQASFVLPRHPQQRAYAFCTCLSQQ